MKKSGLESLVLPPSAQEETAQDQTSSGSGKKKYKKGELFKKLQEEGIESVYTEVPQYAEKVALGYKGGDQDIRDDIADFIAARPGFGETVQQQKKRLDKSTKQKTPSAPEAQPASEGSEYGIEDAQITSQPSGGPDLSGGPSPFQYPTAKPPKGRAAAKPPKPPTIPEPPPTAAESETAEDIQSSIYADALAGGETGSFGGIPGAAIGAAVGLGAYALHAAQSPQGSIHQLLPGGGGGHDSEAGNGAGILAMLNALNKLAGIRTRA